MKSYEYRSGVVQTLAALGDVPRNIEIAEFFVRKAAALDVKLLVFPECMNIGYLYDSVEHAKKLAEPVDGPFTSALAALAKRYKMFIASGITEWDKDKEKIFNSGVLLDAEGDLIGHYHKQFLATHDQNWFEFGERGFPIVETELGRLGMMICFDGRIPEIARCTALSGADVIVDMANFFVLDQAEMWGPARAYENGVWLCAATKSGQERAIYYPGGSMIVDPRGVVRAQVPYDVHDLAVTEVDPTLARDKSIFGNADRFSDRRPEAYAVMARPYEETQVAEVVQEAIVPGSFAFKFAAIQSHVSSELGVGIDDVVVQVSHAARLGIKVIVLPEYVAAPEWQVDSLESAQALAAGNKKWLERLGAISREYGCYILYSSVEGVGGDYIPTSFLISADGSIAGRYQKVHLYSDEKGWATAGNDFPVFETPFGRLGVMMGYDGMFPEAARCLGLNGADVILWPTRLQDQKERKFLAGTRSADNRVALVMANRVDAPFPGGSMVLPPMQLAVWDVDAVNPYYRDLGKVVFGFVDLTSARQKNLIGKVDMFKNRLTHTYGPIVAKGPQV